MNTKIALLGLGGIGVAGYLLYNYLSNTSMSSQTSVGSGSQLPIGQATPYETTGHLEDPLITQLLNSIQSEISNLQSTVPIGTTTTITPTTLPPVTAINLGGTLGGNNGSVSSTSSGGNGGPYNGQGGGNWNFGGGYHLPFIAPPAKTATTTTTTTTVGGKTISGNNYNVGNQSNANNTQQIQQYNKYYQAPTQSQISGKSSESATSTVGNIITGTAVNTIQNIVKDFGGSQSQATTASNAYLNTTRPVVTTLESYAHPVIAAANTAISDLNGAVSSVASDVSNASKVVNSVENNVASSIGSFFKGW